VDPYAKTIRGNTSLHYACKYGLAEVVKELLEKGADVHAKNNDGKTPLYKACRSVYHVNQL
jgi:ankyrin repeat protein